MIIVAIDPGKHGGVAVRRSDTNPPGLLSYGMPETEGDLIAELSCYAQAADGVLLAAIEDVPKFVGKAIPESAAAVLHRNFGFVLGVCQALGYMVQLVRPQIWQASLGLGKRGDLTKGAWKNKLKAEAQRLFPTQKVTLETADALLLLHYIESERKEVAA